MLELQNKQEKIYLIGLVISAIILIFTTVYFTYNCPKCGETYNIKKDQSVIVYRIG